MEFFPCFLTRPGGPESRPPRTASPRATRGHQYTSSGSGRARVQRAPILAPALQWLLRVPLDPRPTTGTSQLQARSQVAGLQAAGPKAEHSPFLVLFAHCLLSSNGVLPRPQALLAYLGGRLPFCFQPSAAQRQAALTLGHLLQRRLSPARAPSQRCTADLLSVSVYSNQCHMEKIVHRRASFGLRRARAPAARNSCRASATGPPTVALPRVARFLLAPSVALPRVARFLLAPFVALPRVAWLPHSSSRT